MIVLHASTLRLRVAFFACLHLRLAFCVYIRAWCLCCLRLHAAFMWACLFGCLVAWLIGWLVAWLIACSAFCLMLSGVCLLFHVDIITLFLLRPPRHYQNQEVLMAFCPSLVLIDTKGVTSAHVSCNSIYLCVSEQPCLSCASPSPQQLFHRHP